MDHDLYKPLFQIRLSDLDPARHVLVTNCMSCGLILEIDFVKRLAEDGDHLIRWLATMCPCPNCRKPPQDYRVGMKPGVRMRTLKEVDPNR